MSNTHYLPSKILAHLKRLELEYNRTGDGTRCDVVRQARVAVDEGAEYDNWNGGTYGHAVLLFLPEEVFGRIGLREQADVGRSICEDLNACERVDNEFYSEVRLSLNDETDPNFLRSVPYSQRPQVNPDTLPFWKPGNIRLFISHRDNHKRKAFELAEALDHYGVSSFVAHDTIQPTKEWRREIMSGLETMEIMLIFLTDNFHESPWTNQEVGFALGKGIPIISVKLEGRDPPGFISHEQALRGTLEDPGVSARDIHRLLVDKLGRWERVKASLIASFVSSPSWVDARDRFDILKETVTTLTDEDVETIAEGYAGNDQLYTSIYLNNSAARLKRYLESATKKRFSVESKKIVELD